MIIRQFERTDIEELKKVYDEGNYITEYPFDIFSDPHYIDLFTVVDEGGLISAGGIRLTPEIVVATDKSRSIRDRREALLNILQAAEYITKTQGFRGFSASTVSDNWYQQLLKYGFQASTGKPLYYPVY